MTISETANVSPSKAKEIVTNLQSKGYSINKSVIEETENIELLWFKDGWDDRYPVKLDWTVSLESDMKDTNIIVGYENGILKIKPIGEDQRLHIVASYFDLKDEYKEKPPEIKALEQKIKDLEESKKDLEDTLSNMIEAQQKDEDESMRDISKATWYVVKLGIVKVERFWFVTAASGVFLGNIRARKNFSGYDGSRYWGEFIHYNMSKYKAVILTNAHVANIAMSFSVYVSKDKEIMWILYPGVPFIRYTRMSDSFGSPAYVLSIDDHPVISSDYDCAIMVTSPVPEYEQYKAILGDSDNVKEGQKIYMVGNPAMMQKYSTEGIISNTHYSFLDRLDFGYMLKKYGMDGRLFNWLRHSNFWIDCPIGIGGTSGSGVWALNGPERGKVIALHNMGLMTQVSAVASESKGKMFDAFSIKEDSRIKDTRKWTPIFKDFSYEDADFSISGKQFIEDNEPLKECGGMVAASGMNGAVPINPVKRFLQERGLDPRHFGWRGIASSYWEK